MPKILVNGIELYYEAQGSGEPVLLVPPNWWPCAAWNVGVVPQLSRRYRTLIYDGRGTGGSDKPNDGYTVSQFAQDAIELFAALGVKRCHAVGFAIGAQIMQAMAIERPDLVATLTMAASGPGKRRLDGSPRDVGSEAIDEIQKIGFEQYIQTHVDNDVMGVQSTFIAITARSGQLSLKLSGRARAPSSNIVSTNSLALVGILSRRLRKSLFQR